MRKKWYVQEIIGSPFEDYSSEVIPIHVPIMTRHWIGSSEGIEE